MTGLDLSHLSGPDAAVAMRSYGRRFRQAILPLDDDPDAEELAQRIGPDGHSALELVVDTTHTWVLLAQALHQVVVQDGPVLHPGVLDAHERVWDGPPAVSLHDALTRLEDEAGALAEAIEHIHSPDWSRTATVAGGAAVTALDLAKEAVRTGADNLRLVVSTLASVRR
jgi:hypothetical protein